MQTEIVSVYNKDLLQWHKLQLDKAAKDGKSVNKLRVCHRCMYGDEYNRKDEMAYLSFVKGQLSPVSPSSKGADDGRKVLTEACCRCVVGTANKLFASEGYQNFARQPGKQAVIAAYRAASSSRCVSSSCVSSMSVSRMRCVGIAIVCEWQSQTYLIPSCPCGNLRP
eukprot:1290054-Rhodomonas_salina.3